MTTPKLQWWIRHGVCDVSPPALLLRPTGIWCGASVTWARRTLVNRLCGQNLLLNFTEVHVDVKARGDFLRFHNRFHWWWCCRWCKRASTTLLFRFLQSLIVFLSGPLQSMFNSPSCTRRCWFIWRQQSVQSLAALLQAGSNHRLYFHLQTRTPCALFCFLWSCSSCMKGPSVQARRNAFMLTLSYLVAEVVF